MRLAHLPVIHRCWLTQENSLAADVIRLVLNLTAEIKSHKFKANLFTNILQIAKHSHWWKKITFSNSLNWQDHLWNTLENGVNQPGDFCVMLSNFMHVDAQCCFSSRMVDLTDVRDDPLPFASHLWKVQNRPICAGCLLMCNIWCLTGFLVAYVHHC